MTHPEAKAAGPDGKPCGPFTTGELTRLQVLVTGFVHIRKESHDLEDVQAGLTPAISTYVHYRDRQAELEELRRTLRPLSLEGWASWALMQADQMDAVALGEQLPEIEWIGANCQAQRDTFAARLSAVCRPRRFGGKTFALSRPSRRAVICPRPCGRGWSLEDLA